MQRYFLSIIFFFITQLLAHAQFEENAELSQAYDLTRYNKYYYLNGIYDQLVNNELQASEIFKKYNGINSIEYRSSLFNLAIYLCETDSISKAIQVLEQAKTCISSNDQNFDYWQAHCASWLSYFYALLYEVDIWSRENQVISKKYAQYALSFFSGKSQYKKEYAIALTHSSLTKLYDKSSISNCERAIKLFRSIGINNYNLDYIYTQAIYSNCLECQLSSKYKSDQTFTFEISDDNFKSHLRRKENRNIELPHVVNNCRFYAEACFKEHEYEESIERYEIILSVYKKVYGENEVYADMLNGIAESYSHVNNNSIAIKYASKAQDIYDNLKLNKSTNIFAYRNKDQINNQKFEKNPLSLYEEILMQNNTSYADILRQQNRVLALDTNLSQNKAFGGNYNFCYMVRNGEPIVCVYPSNFGMKGAYSVYEWLNMYNNTLESAGKAIKERLKSCVSAEDFANNQYALSRYYFYTGDHSKILKTAEKASELYLQIYGKADKTYITSLQNLSLLYNQYIWKSLSEKKYSEANKYKLKLKNCVNDILKSSQELIDNNILNYTSSEREFFWKQYSEWYNEALPYFALFDDFGDVVFKGLSFSNNFLFNCEKRIKDYVLKSRNSEIKKTWDNYIMLKDALIHLQGNTHVEDSLENFAIKCDDEERHLLRLISKEKDFSILNNNLSIWQDRLGPESVFVYFLNFNNLGNYRLYCAAIFQHESKNPIIVPLFTEEQLKDSQYNANHYTSSVLYDIVWAPIESHLKEKKNVYVIPSGMLCCEGIEYYPDSLGVTASSKWCIYRLSSPQELLLTNSNDSSRKNIEAALYGGLKYDVDISDMIEESSRYCNSNYYYAKRGVSENNITRGRFGNLKGTSAEIDSIYNNLKLKTDVNVSVFKNEYGNEESVKNLSGKNNLILHFATHGFYWTPQNAERQESKHKLSFLNPYYSNSSAITKEDRSMTRSGLAFSGANAVLMSKKIPEGVEDGILTAAEASLLDFSKCDILIMSACQTGLGDIQVGEGVYGLQRGFKKAGVKSILMSLWEVDDEATRMLMVEFYKHYLNHESKLESLLKAQQFVKSQPDFEDPKYWAGFILLDGLD